MNWDTMTRRMKVNPEGVTFYHALIDELRAHSIEPILTLYHWDLPSELQAQLSGWLNPGIVDHFVEYATLMFHEFGTEVTFWSTFNEPLSFILGGYGKGFNALGYSGDETFEYTVCHTVLVAHGKAVQVFRALQSEG
jgi:beta-glucosidase/6-phospho-beta-glucosidase/beta-galactosidase